MPTGHKTESARAPTIFYNQPFDFVSTTLEHYAENRKSSANRYNCNHLHDWRDIADEFKDGCLLLGNGASIAIDDRFKYSSLFDEAVRRGHLSPEITGVFDELHTRDFEYAMRRIDETSRLCATFGQCEAANEWKGCYEEVRKALIGTITDIHPTYQDVNRHFRPIASFLRRFRTVLSLNYDLTVYWAAMQAKKHGHEFKDCFNHGEFNAEWWKRYRNGDDRVTLLFSPHGNLCLVNEGGVETKVKRGRSTELLDMIGNRWRDGATPIFVSEGKSSDKQRAIEEHRYTRLIRDEVYGDIKTSLVIYGCSLGENDDHILRSLFENRIERVAVSVWTGQSVEEQRTFQMNALEKLRRFGSDDLDVKFFDSRSKGCWIHRGSVQKNSRGPKPNTVHSHQRSSHHRHRAN